MKSFYVFEDKGDREQKATPEGIDVLFYDVPRFKSLFLRDPNQLGDHSYSKIPETSVISEFTQVYSLPCSKVQPAILDRNGNRMTNNRRFQMSRHIIIKQY